MAIRPVRTSRWPESGFTLIEVLVVVAIIAVLVAILLPSLAKAREQARTSLCASQLKEFGKGTIMYSAEQRDSLPGPIHGALELESYQKVASSDYEQWHLPWFIRRYFAEKGRTGEGTDRVSTCPTAERAMRKINFSKTDYRRSFTYALNNWKKGSSASVQYGTDPPWYFGYPDYYWQNAPPPFRPLTSPDKDASPKKLSVIPQPGREWAVADAFRRDDAGYARTIVPGRKDGQWRRGTYQFPFVTDDNLIPREPYHSGGINVLCFDAHVEWQRPWRGTINAAK